MPFRPRIKVTGFEEYLEKLAKAGKDIDRAASRAVSTGAQIIVDGMKTRAPVRTGQLKSIIKKFGPYRDGNFHYVTVGPDLGKELANYGKRMPGGKLGAWRKISKNSRSMRRRRLKSWGRENEYAIYVEFGHGKTKARPYALPTIQRDQGKMRKAMKKVFEDEGLL